MKEIFAIIFQCTESKNVSTKSWIWGGEELWDFPPEVPAKNNNTFDLGLCDGKPLWYCSAVNKSFFQVTFALVVSKSNQLWVSNSLIHFCIDRRRNMSLFICLALEGIEGGWLFSDEDEEESASAKEEMDDG